MSQAVQKTDMHWTVLRLWAYTVVIGPAFLDNSVLSEFISYYEHPTNKDLFEHPHAQGSLTQFQNKIFIFNGLRTITFFVALLHKNSWLFHFTWFQIKECLHEDLYFIEQNIKKIMDFKESVSQEKFVVNPNVCPELDRCELPLSHFTS